MKGFARPSAVMARGVMREQRTPVFVILSEAKDLEFPDFRPFGREKQVRGLRVTVQETCSERSALANN